MDTICPSLPATIDSGDKQAKPVDGRKNNPGNPLIAFTSRTPITNGVNAALEDAFHNDKDPQYEIKFEKPKHRMMILLASLGMAIKDIAAEVNSNAGYVSQVLRQSWARELIQEEIRCRHEEDITRLLSGKGKEAYMRVVEISERAQSEQVKLAAYRELLDRWLGKPSQHVQVSQKLEELSDAELAKIVSEGRKQ